MSDDAPKTPRRRKTGGTRAPAKKARSTRKKPAARAAEPDERAAVAGGRTPAAGLPARRDSAPEPPARAEAPAATDAPVPEPRPADPLADFFYSPAEGGGTGALIAAAVQAATPVASAEEDVEEAEAEYLSFWLASELYAVPVSALREIVRPLPITEVPRTPPWILGVITLRGTVLPVFDLRLRLGLPVTDAERTVRILVLEGDDGYAGILADRVDQVVRAGDDLEPAPGALGNSDHIQGLLRRDGRMIIVLNLDGALRVDERRTRETA